MPVSADEVVVRKITVAERDAFIRSAEERARVEMSTPGLVRSHLDVDSTQFVLPLFEVEAAGPLTTLFAIRNIFDDPNPLLVSYFDRFGNFITDETFLAPPSGVVTRNIRDVPGIPAEPDGVRRGFVVISGSGAMSGDYFSVDSVNNFAAGDRLIPGDEVVACSLWDFRLVHGGGFGGSTEMVVFLNQPLGSDSSSVPPSIVFDLYDEPGNFLGSYSTWTSAVVVKISAQQILQSVGDPAITGGVFDIFIDPAVGGGWVQGAYSAEGRYSIGMHGTCWE